MSIAIDQTSVVFLFGRDASKNFENILEYWHNAIDDSAWKKVLFVRVAQKEHLVNLKLDREFYDMIQDRCIDIACDQEGNFGFSESTITEIRRMRAQGQKLYIQAVIGDSGERGFNPQTAVRVISYVQDRLGVGGHPCIYYLLVHSNHDARLAQRALVREALDAELGRPCFYLLSSKTENGGVAEDYEIWRALAYEMLICMHGDQGRAHSTNAAYSLGYSSLNADGSELKLLRRDRLKTVVRELCSEPMTDARAWRLLLGLPEEYNIRLNTPKYEMSTVKQVLRDWLKTKADNEMFKLDEQRFENFRILADLKQNGDVDRIREAVACLYEYNYQASCWGKMRKSIGDKFSDGFRRLLNQPNASQFPLELIDTIMRALNELAQERRTIRPSNTPFPKRRMLQTKDDYIAACCKIASSDMGAYCCDRLMCQAAEMLGQWFAKLRSIVSRMAAAEEQNYFFRTLDREMRSSNMTALKQKYVKYIDNIHTVMTQKSWLLDADWVKSFAPFYSDDGVMLTEKLSMMMSAGEKRLRENLDPGFSGSFINTLRHELTSMQNMEQFLNNYMSDPQRMFFYLHDQGGSPLPLYFVDDGLKDTDWLRGHANESVIVDNDNIEKICWYQLQKSAEELLKDESGANEAFGTYPDKQFSEAEDPTHSPRESGEPQKPAPAFPPAEADTSSAEGTNKDNPRNIRLFERDRRYFLAWDWEPGLQGMLVWIGNNQKSCSVTEYNIKGGADVTDMVQVGKNHVTLQRSDRSLYAEQDVGGRMRGEVRYLFLSRANGYTLKIKGFPAGSKQLVVRDANDKTPFYYPVRNGQDAPDRNYEGLRLTGTEKRLITTPGDKFPTFSVKEDPSLY